MTAVCTNPGCPEQELPKDASGLVPLPPVIHCGHCGRPCDIREPAAE